MINKDGTLNFEVFARKSQIKNSNYQKDPKLDILLTNQNIIESETKRDPNKDPQLNYYYGKNLQKSEKSLRGTVTREARTTHANDKNIVGKFIQGGNAQMLLNQPRRDRSKEKVLSSRKEDSNGFGFARRKEETSLYKNSINPRSVKGNINNFFL